MTEERVPSIGNQATSPAANSAPMPLIWRNWSTGTRPKRSCSTGKRRVSGCACMPAHQTIVAASMRSPFDKVAPSLSIAAMEIPGCFSIPSDDNASSMTSRASLAHVGTDPGLPIGDDHPRDVRPAAQRATQFSGRLGCDLDPGQAAAHNQGRPLAGGSLARGQICDMGI